MNMWDYYERQDQNENIWVKVGGTSGGGEFVVNEVEIVRACEKKIHGCPCIEM